MAYALALQVERDVPVQHMYKVLHNIDSSYFPATETAHKNKDMVVGGNTFTCLVGPSFPRGVPVTNEWFRDEVEFAILREEYAIARSLLDHISEWVRRTEQYAAKKKIEDDMIVLRAPAPDLHPTAHYTVSWGTLRLIHGWVTGQYKKG